MVTLMRARYWVTIIAALTMPAVVVQGVLAAPKKQAPPPPPPAPTNPPNITLTLVANELARDWSLRVTNTGLEPLRIVADARALSLEITAPNGGPVVKCTVPPEMRPLADNGPRTLVLVGGRSYTEHFDPRLYCFGEKEANALVAGATVIGKLGFAPTNVAPPYEVTWALDGTRFDASVAPSPAKEIVSTPLQLTAPTPVVADAGVTPLTATDAVPIHLGVAMPTRTDLTTTFEQTTTLTVTNKDPRAVSLLLRTSTVGFTVELPQGGIARCGGSTGATAIRELLTTLPAGGRASVAVDFDAVCPDVFARPGLYVVRPRIDTRRVTGSVSSFQGEALGDPVIVRVRTGRGDDRASPKPDPAH